MGIFSRLGNYFLNVVRVVIWFVLFVALILVAYCLVRLLALAFHYVNEHWFSGYEGMGLIFATIIVLILGLTVQYLLRPAEHNQFRRSNRFNLRTIEDRSHLQGEDTEEDRNLL